MTEVTEFAFKYADCTNCLQKIPLQEFLDHDHACEKCYYDFLDLIMYGPAEPDPED